jgi:hypothetical protein
MAIKKTSDQVLAKRMLQLRTEGGFRYGTFLRLNTRKYLLQIGYLIVSLALLSFYQLWIPFVLLLGVFFGVWLRDASWVRASRRNWPFTLRVTNWDLVEKLVAEGTPEGRQMLVNPPVSE